MIVPTIAEVEQQLGIDSRFPTANAPARPRCATTCQPTVEHHFASRRTYARCWACGATASPVHWPTADNPPTSTTDALNNFRQEFGHAD